MNTSRRSEAGARIVCLTPHVPSKNVRHAGGDYLNKHLAALDAEVVVVSFRNQLNEANAATCPYDVILVGDEREDSRIGHTLGVLQRASSPWKPRRNVRSDLTRRADIRQLLSSADLIEFHWPETVGLYWLVREIADCPITIVPHDLLSLRYKRQMTSRVALLRTAHAILYQKLVAYIERRTYPKFDAILCFSTVEKASIERFSSSSLVINPPVEVNRDLRIDRDENVVLFTGALSRSVNDEAGCRLVSIIWPIVQQSCPDAELVIAGSNPSLRLRSLCESEDSITLHVNVESMSRFYLEAGTFVAPLLRGAGVKFKCIEALLAGCRVVSSEVGAEGISSRYFYGIANEDRGLAELVVSSLLDKGTGDSHAGAAFELESIYSIEGHRQRLRELYRGLIDV